MRANPRRSAGLALAALLLAAPGAAAQTQFKSRAMEVTISGRLHAMWDYSSANDDLSNLFLIRRARVSIELKINDFVSGKIEPDYSTGFDLEDGLVLKDVYVRLNFGPAFSLKMGQFKRPFDLFELTSSTQILVIERTGEVRSADSCAGVSRICSYSRLTERLEYSDRDVGLLFEGELASGRLFYGASLTNGTRLEGAARSVIGQDTVDLYADSKSFSGRLGYRLDDLTLAANIAGHDYANAVTGDENEYAFAYGADLEWGNYDSGFHLQAGVTAGDNWLSLDAEGDASSFWTTQGIATYRLPIANSLYVQAVEPVARVSYADPNTDAGDDEGLLLTPGLVVHFVGRNKIAVNADIYVPGASGRDTEFSVKTMMYLHF